uniref:Ig-like domain-containing protein n=1 Tax=Echeneis naucrates TaxID=173247 RepID=A0A665T3C2_ECHNA
SVALVSSDEFLLNVLLTFPTNPVRVSAGEDVILNCEVEPPFNLTEKTVEWKYFNTSNDEFLVHVFRNERDDPSSQDDKFKNRTSLFHDQLKEGNLSLKLLSVNLNDEGNYTCIVKKLNGSDRRGQIQLFVSKITQLLTPSGPAFPTTLPKALTLSSALSSALSLSSSLLSLLQARCCIKNVNVSFSFFLTVNLH